MNRTGVILAITFFFFSLVPAHAEFVSSPVTRTDDGLYRNVTPALVNASSLGVVSPITKGVYGGQTAFKLDGRLDKDANGALSYAGYSDSFRNNIGWDAGVSLYHSDDQKLNDFAEVYGGLSYKVFRTRFALANDYFGTHGYRALLEAGMAMNFGDGYGVGVHVGRSSFDNRTGLKGFTGYRINLSREVEGFDLGVNFTHSGYDAVRLSEENYSGSVLEDSAFNFTITKDF
ncbi:MAG: TorF family putative porin [Gammaproteobacteria bacterium]|nr:TorF family putative porin [Gammaproteobacteria bacterium]MDH5594772.1 TorF family putative porin [Gammaproteobacteria bacterium]